MLIFTHLSRVVAVVGLLLGVFFFWMSYKSSFLLDTAIATQESERHFKMGFIALFGAIFFGTLAEISFSLRQKKDETDT